MPVRKLGEHAVRALRWAVRFWAIGLCLAAGQRPPVSCQR